MFAVYIDEQGVKPNRTAIELTSGGKRGPNPRFSPPRPQIIGDGAGMETRYEKTLEIFWGRVGLKIGGFWCFIPENPQKKIWG